MAAVLHRLLTFDREAHRQNRVCGLMAGVDEVGRGPLAGPVVAAAVIFIRKFSTPGLNDSKQVSPKTRQRLFWEILKHSLIGIGAASEEEIDTINIYQASRLAMKRAILSLTRTPDFVLVDGKMKLDVPLPQKAVIGGDAKSASIAAASIIAKVYRDHWMEHLDSLYPEYFFKAHKGYGTPRHLEQLHKIGPSPVHRKTFEPVRTLLEKVFV